MALRTKRADGIDLTDPQEQVSLAGWFALSIFLLLLSTVWAIYEEVWGLRPWKEYQGKFVEAARVHYKKKLKVAKAEYDALMADEDSFGEDGPDDGTVAAREAYEASVEKVEDATAEYKSQKAAQDALIAERNKALAELEDVRATLGKIRSFYQADVYQWEQVRDEASKAALKAKIDSREGDVLKLTARMTELSGQVKDLGDRIFAFEKSKNAAEGELNRFRAEVSKFEGMIKGLDDFKIVLRQNHLKEWGSRADRCISCHVGATQPDLEDIRETLAEMPEFWGDLDKWESLFRSHPGDHLKIHDPATFGCTSCHAGDGYSLSTLTEAHGSHSLHEYPLLVAPGGVDEPFGHMAEAGCNKCHLQEQEFPGAPLISYGKQTFTEIGCIACHKAKGIMPELDELEDEKKHFVALERTLELALERQKELPFVESRIFNREEKLEERIDARIEKTEEDYGEDDPEILEEKLAIANAFFADEKAALEAEKQAFADESRTVRQTIVEARDGLRISRAKQVGLQKNIKLHGPNLLNVKDKLRPDFLYEWLANPHAFNPETKMPRFWFLDEENEEDQKLLERQIQGVAAYLWQTADPPTANYDRPAPQDEELIAEGEELFESSGCLACHIGGDHDGEVIDTRKGIAGTDVKKRMYGPTLVRTGEKARFDHLERWIYDPKSLNPRTRMPNMRLSEEQSRAIAAYLTTQKEEEVDAAAWKDVPGYLDDEELAKEGYETIQRYGCYSCHMIRNVSDARGEWEQLDDIIAGKVETTKPLMGDEFGRIGVELSSHGSKNLHLFDFGLIEPKVHHEIHGSKDGLLTRYDYIHYKIEKPRSFQEGRYYVNALDDARLRMPSFNLKNHEAHALGTFVVSLVEGELPEHLVYDPEYPQGAVPLGRNLALKHNCVACHAIDNKGGNIREVVYKDILGDINLGPPDLWSQGRKVQPEWLFHFLKLPYELRPHVLARMPYFDLSDGEAQDLVEYFSGMDKQPFPYETESPVNLTRAEIDEAEQLFEQLRCAQCHKIGSSIPELKIAPPLDLAPTRLKPEWVVEWVRNPANFVPGMNMPAFGDSLRAMAEQKGLSGDAAAAEVDRQLRLIADYLRVLNTDYQPATGPYVPDLGRTGE